MMGKEAEMDSVVFEGSPSPPVAVNQAETKCFHF